MSNGFVHSVKVPRIYKTAANIVKKVREESASFKSLIYEKKHPNVSGIFALTTNTLQRSSDLDYLIRKTRILINEQRLDPWLARVLITELLWGKQCLSSECKPVQTILSYEKQLKEELKSIDKEDSEQLKYERVKKKPRYVRINTLLMTVNDAIYSFQAEGWNLIPKCETYSSHLDVLRDLTQSNFIQDFHVPELLVFPSDVTFHDHVGYQNGQFVLQDKASCLPAYLLNPEPGSVVLDMCAAPGMKTTHLAAMMQNKGKIYASEIEPRRYGTLCDQVKKSDCICVEPLMKDALTLDAHQCPGVEYILVDPSCSGSGMTDRQLVESRGEKCPPARLKGLQSFQVFVLRHALLNFPTAKRIVYSTCSIHPEENEEVIDEVLRIVKETYRLVSAKQVFGQNWVNYSSKEYQCSDNCLYAKPDDDFCNGFFVAIFERNFDIPLPTYKLVVEDSKAEDFRNREDAEDIDNKLSRKRKKRGKKKKKSEDATDEQTMEPVDEEKYETFSEPINDNNEYLDEATNEVPKKKKRKSKHKDNEDENINENENPAPNEIQKQPEYNDAELQEVLENETPKKKKKKSKHKDAGEEHLQECGNEVVKKKKKKSKEKDNEDEVLQAMEEETPKKKKKKKKSKDEDDDN